MVAICSSLPRAQVNADSSLVSKRKKEGDFRNNLGKKGVHQREKYDKNFEARSG